MVAKACATCARINCTEHQHQRDRNAHWSANRSRTNQARFRRQVLKRDHHTCQRCSHHDPTGRTLEAHHLRPGYHAHDGITVCTTEANGCHAAIDPHAR